MNDSQLIEERKPRFAAWLVEPMLDNKPTYIKVGLAAFMINVFALATPLYTMTVYDRVVPNSATASLVALSIGLGIVIVFDFVLRTLRAYFTDIAGARIDRDVGRGVFEHVLNIRLDQKRGSTGALTGLMRELESLRDFFASATITSLIDLPFILLSLLIIFLIGGPIVIVPALVVPIVILVAYFTQPILDEYTRKAMGQGLLKQAVLVETIGGLEMVKTSNAGTLLSQRWADSIKHHANFSLRQRLVSAVSINAATTGQMISYAGVIIIGVGLIQSQSLSLGGLIACAILSGRTLAPLGQIASLLTRLSMTRTAYREINALMETPVEGEGGDALELANVDGKIEFRKVDFRYPEASEKALENVSFTIQPGEHVAILGKVGSGKSTIAKLVLGLFPPEDGLVMLDGMDTRQLKAGQLRHYVGAAMQESVLLSGSVRENIVLGRPAVDNDEMIRAATISGTHDFIGRIANGYDLRLTDRGESLSGGQRQSMALARALAGKPPIFVLDEPTSAMDAQTEAALLDRLESELRDRTLILITHRPPMLRLVDRIIWIDGGKVRADGPRDEVLKSMQVLRPADPKDAAAQSGSRPATKKPRVVPSVKISKS